MKQKIMGGVLVLSAFLCLPFLVGAKDKDDTNGTKLKLKEVKIIQMIPEQGAAVVKKKDNIYNIAFGLADEDKFELLSKYGIMVDPLELKAGDVITCRGRNFPEYFVPSKCRMEKGSQEDLYKKKKGYMVADVYAVDPASETIYAAHSLNKTDVTTIDIDDTDVKYKGEKRGLSKIEPYWRLVLKGTWNKSKEKLEKITKAKIISKHKNEPEYGY